MLLKLGKIDEASMIFEKLMEVDPSNTQTLNLKKSLDDLSIHRSLDVVIIITFVSSAASIISIVWDYGRRNEMKNLEKKLKRLDEKSHEIYEKIQQLSENK